MIMESLSEDYRYGLDRQGGVRNRMNMGYDAANDVSGVPAVSSSINFVITLLLPPTAAISYSSYP